MAAVLLLCAIRLTGNWIHGFPGLHHEDWRYSMIRERAGRFRVLADLFAIHVIPTLQVFAGLIPVYLVATRAGEPLGRLDGVAFAVGTGAVDRKSVVLGRRLYVRVILG